MIISLTPEQENLVHLPLYSKVFVHGPAASGKTTAALARLRFLLAQGIPAESILLLTPQRTLQEPYLDLLASAERQPGGEITPATIGGLARRMVDLFWPLAAEAAGFAHPEHPPIFLTLETAQYYMAHLVRPLLDEGFFESVTIDRNRLYSQIIDNLNKSALVGFPYTEIGARLQSAWAGDPVQLRIYADAQECASRFRHYCLEHNLLDFSLQLEVFANHLWPHPLVRQFLTRTYRHLIWDNIEEDAPRAHDIVAEWLPELDSAVLIFDEGGGHRSFLGADVESAWALSAGCEQHLEFPQNLVMPQSIRHLHTRLVSDIAPHLLLPEEQETAPLSPESLPVIARRFYPELLDAIADEIQRLIFEEGLPPSEIVILAPYLSDALRFSLLNRLEARQIPVRSHRPSRSLRDEPAAQALITLAALAHPRWEIHPPKPDLAYALMQAIDGMDLVRAQLLTEIVYRRNLTLTSFDDIKSDMQERITFTLGDRYNALRQWILAYRQETPIPLDHFFRKLFGEILSQPGFGYHHDFEAVRVAATLIESVKKFRQTMEIPSSSPAQDYSQMGWEYVKMLQEGVIAASYVESWRIASKETVLIAPAYTFLMMNRPVSVQFWLDIGSSGWYERLSQPLTHPYVLSRHWPAGRTWNDADEVEASRLLLARLISGLLHRCKDRIYLGLAEIGESGFEQRGELLRAFQKLLTPS
jgi:hypothetical protein